MTRSRTLSTSEAAERSGLSEVRLRAMASNGEIKGARKEGGEWRLPEAGLPERRRGSGADDEEEDLRLHRARESHFWRALEERDRNVADAIAAVQQALANNHTVSTEALASVRQALANNQTLSTLVAERLSGS